MAWELASGGSKESGLSGLFRGASLLSRQGEAISVLSGLKNRTALLYFASSADICRKFTPQLRKFYELARENDDSIMVIFVSDDETKEEQLAFFRGEDMHPDWLMVELLGVEDIMDAFEVKKIPSLVVLDRDGKSVVDGARDQVWDMFQAHRKDPDGLKAAVGKTWEEWRRAAGDWRASQGHTLGGGGGASSSSSGAAAAWRGGAPGIVPAAGTRSDREALRAARLAALERRGLGGAGDSASAGFDQQAAPGASSSCSSAPAPGGAAAAAPPPDAAAPASGGGAASQAASGGGAAASASSGSGTFAAGAVGAAGLGGTAYTLAGGKIELPKPASKPSGLDEEDVVSDMASDGERSFRDETDLPEVDVGEAVQQIADMGFPEDAARRALQASNGDVDQAVAMLLGE